MVILSFGFSVAFYYASVSAIADVAPMSIEKRTQESARIAEEQANLMSKLDSLRDSLKYRLAILNIGVIVGGGMLSYVLARRTLRPVEDAMESQSRFVSDASHELRTPIAALRVRNEVTLRKPSHTLAEAEEAMRSSIEQAVRLEKLSDGLLRLSGKDSKGFTKNPVSLEEVATEAMNHVLGIAQAKHITLEGAVPNIVVVGDMQSLVQIVTILLDNAIKYSNKGQTIHVFGGVDGKYAYVCVRDDGVGIRAVDLPHIFERFYRGDTSRSKQDDYSYGLGLAIAQKLTAQNGGEITAKSTLGKGTTFTVKIPRSLL
jgi:signal transduction histidine kinase